MGLLHNAVRRSDLDEVQKVVARGANVNAIDSKGYTPLMVAVEIENYEITEYLLKHGAVKSIGHTNRKGETAFDLTEDDDILELLSKYEEEGFQYESDGGGGYFGPSVPAPDGNI
ncbi:ankyrin repeat and btb poz domain protein [Fusarium tjaetaba]|uniref:Ankyrin repeat and btb poz domain protein n=1 Tax=Fusarium tjaetaba TaxID=1567544 RepID=A0A8H5VLA3_9HYPO|nr:ankyrin repeat and btb poz domain protein [Fusarium tjaetaba]KAF5626373.1 ankyrin repeat and btb poz domain protein [Fusarium tjaetaba]